jgi:nitroreductase
MDTIEMMKQPDAGFTIHPLLAARWSPRAYSHTPVESEKLQRIFEAARWAPSSSNIQPWYFLVGYRGDEVYKGIAESLVEFNRLWAEEAPILVLTLVKKNSPKGELNKSRFYDLGQAVAMLSVQATAEGVYVHQMGGFDADAAARNTSIPDDMEAVTAFTLGYRGDANQLHPNLLRSENSPRSRRPLDETVFAGAYGSKADFLL